MGDQEVRVRLNQQQLELVDRTVTETGAAGREEVLLRALREQHASQSAAADERAGDAAAHPAAKRGK